MRCRVGTDVCADDPKTLVTAPHLIGYRETGQEVSELLRTKAQRNF
jgi:hypothetical protein